MAHSAKADRKRLLFQLLWTGATNSYAAGFLTGTIYQGPLKQICFPGLNCYSCPGALGSCPLGAVQNELAGFISRVPLYAAGWILLLGSLVGRAACGWLCPFGLVQDLLFRLPWGAKVRTPKGHGALRQLKYAVLAMTLLLPLLLRDGGGGSPWFCKLLCPSGTLTGGWPLALLTPEIRAALGWLFAWKSAVLAALLALSIRICRPFCRYLCPLGACYGLLNRYSIYRYDFDRASCLQCGACAQACPMSVPMPAQTDSAECIRCGRCLTACPTGALSPSFFAGARGQKGGKGIWGLKSSEKGKENHGADHL